MNESQRKIVLNAYNTFNISTRYNDFEAVGKLVFIRRMLAELLGLDLSKHIIPGEYISEENNDIDLIFINASVEKMLVNAKFPITKHEEELIRRVLTISLNISGASYKDDVALKSARRMLAEVIEYQPLEHFQLIGEGNVKPLYYKKTELKIAWRN